MNDVTEFHKHYTRNAGKRIVTGAEISTTRASLVQIVDREVRRLDKILAEGMDPAYRSFDEFLCDWGADFSWNTWSMVEFAALLLDERWMALAERIKAKHGYDFIKAVRDGRDQEI